MDQLGHARRRRSVLTWPGRPEVAFLDAEKRGNLLTGRAVRPARIAVDPPLDGLGVDGHPDRELLDGQAGRVKRGTESVVRHRIIIHISGRFWDAFAELDASGTSGNGL